MAAADFESLKEFVDSDELKRVQAIVEQMTVAQRSELAINKEDIYFAFPSDVGITENEDDSSEGNTKRIFVEVMMVFHLLRGLQQLKDSEVDIPLNIGYVSGVLFESARHISPIEYFQHKPRICKGSVGGQLSIQEGNDKRSRRRLDCQ